MNVYVDTCVLPERGKLRAGALALMAPLARRGDFQLVLPRLVITEYANLRQTRATQAVNDLRVALKKAYDHLPGIGELYVPSPEEVVDPLIRDLEAIAIVVEVDPRDAAEALRREAARIRPAARGAGARDAAIWLTVVRHHAASGEQGTFMTRNTLDYGDEKDRTSPHPQLLADLGTDIGRFAFAFNPFAFLETLAPPIKVEPILVKDLVEDSDFLSDIAHGLAVSGQFTDEESGIDTGSDASYWEIDPEMMSITSVTSERAYELADAKLTRTKLALMIPVFNEGRFFGVEVEVVAWLEQTSEGPSVLEVETVQRLNTVGVVH